MLKKLLFYSMPIIKVLLFIFFFIFCCIPFLLIAQFDFVNEKILGPLGSNIVSEAVIVFVVISALMMVMKVFKQYDFDDVFIVSRNVFSGFAKGTLMGIALLCLCSLLALLSGNVSFTLGKMTVFIFLGYLVFYILVGIFEEFLFRTFPLLVFGERYPIPLAVLLTSILFGLAHIGNPGFTLIAMVNITLAGALFSVLILVKRNVYWAIGFHFGWNFTQGTLLGYKVSGTEGSGILVAKPMGSTYLSGGSFGIESSIYCTIAMLILIAFLLIRYKIEPILIQEVDEETITT
jgi:membrane protease YdiL (CAAX protease family)